MDVYFDLARKGLSVLNVGYVHSDKLEMLLYKLRNSVIFPANTIEGEILLLSKELADAIEAQKNTDYIENIIEQISNKVTENFFD